ncbi:MAG TPA: hypothetical protein DIU14_04205, partial [Actinobacteria bacterium]|nr:hypothetical protein [Actinomycetota bacterium]
MELALADSQRAFELARSARDPQQFQPVLVQRVAALLAGGHRRGAGALLDELMAGKPDLTDAWLRGLALMMIEVGRGREFLEAAKGSWRSPWLEAEVATAEHRFADAASIYEGVGAPADAAAARLAAGEAAAGSGNRVEAAEHLGRALEFYRGSVPR